MEILLVRKKEKYFQFAQSLCVKTANANMETIVWISVSLLMLTFGDAYNIAPEQIHLSYGVDPSKMVVRWSTMNLTKTTHAILYEGSKNQTYTGTSSEFVSPGSQHRLQYIHTVTFTGLTPGGKYGYRVGSTPENVWSEFFTFFAMKPGTDWSPSIALYGDFGLINAESLDHLKNDTRERMYDTIFHVGDFAYDLYVSNGTRGDHFMNNIQPFAAQVPYMTCPGNHEYRYNFMHYRRRFAMPTDEDGKRMYYSFNIGPAHVISLSTEYYFYIQYGLHQFIDQYEWLKKDLEEATKPENRAKRPWIITLGHRPMYCSNNDKDDCTKYHSLVRDGVPFFDTFGLEKLFYKYGVDLEIWAHEHSYERLWPLYRDIVKNGSYEEPYTNPKAPVHIITGSAGCQEDHDPFKPDPRPWSAFRSVDYGYTRMKIHNTTHLYMEQVSVEMGGQVIDKMMLIKDSHGSYN